LRIDQFERLMAGMFGLQFPEYVFLFGKERGEHKKRQRRQYLVLVSVGVAAMVNLGTAMFVMLVFGS